MNPIDIARLMNENAIGLPVLGSGQQDMPSAVGDMIDAGPTFDQGAGPEQHSASTAMEECAAMCCANNEEGRCTLSTININEHGGCAQYEASAEEGESGRYEEEEAGVDGGSQGPASAEENERHWQTGKWDPRGGGY